MRKVFALATLALAAVALTSAFAEAQTKVWPQLKTERLMWAIYGPNADGTGCSTCMKTALDSGAHYDTTYLATTTVDTTEVLDLADMAWPVGTANGTAGSAMLFVGLTSNTAVTAGTDSLVFFVDKSVDGVRWQALTKFGGIGGKDAPYREVALPMDCDLNDLTLAGNLCGAKFLRFRVASGSASLSQARVYVSYPSYKSN